MNAAPGMTGYVVTAMLEEEPAKSPGVFSKDGKPKVSSVHAWGGGLTADSRSRLSR
jgi:hypothetical protein